MAETENPPAPGAQPTGARGTGMCKSKSSRRMVSAVDLVVASAVVARRRRSFLTMKTTTTTTAAAALLAGRRSQFLRGGGLLIMRWEDTPAPPLMRAAAATTTTMASAVLLLLPATAMKLVPALTPTATRMTRKRMGCLLPPPARAAGRGTPGRGSPLNSVVRLHRSICLREILEYP